MAGQAETQPRQRPRIVIRVTLRPREVESAVSAVLVPFPVIPEVAEVLAATRLRPPPRPQPTALATVSLPRAPEAAQAARAGQAPPLAAA